MSGEVKYLTNHCFKYHILVIKPNPSANSSTCKSIAVQFGFTFAQRKFLPMKKLFIFPIRIYQSTISPLLGRNCRHEPTCSEYTAQAISEWGVIKGVGLGIKRISKCHPWGTSGYDPVPTNPNNKHNK